MSRLIPAIINLEDTMSGLYLYNIGTYPCECLSHSGVIGMKWHVRRFQNADGSLTPAGRARYGSKSNTVRLSEEAKPVNGHQPQQSNKSPRHTTVDDKPVSEMSDQELIDRINRLSNENRYRELTKAPKTKVQKFIERYGNRVADAAFDIALGYVKARVNQELNANRSNNKKPGN